MAVDMSRLTKARQLWPKQTASLATPVQTFYHAWEKCREVDQDATLGTIAGFTHSPNRYSVKQKCRDLTLLRTPLPFSVSSVPPLSEDDVAVNFGDVATPHRRGGDSDSESVWSTPSSDMAVEYKRLCLKMRWCGFVLKNAYKCVSVLQRQCYFSKK